MELSSGVLNRAEYLTAVGRVVELLAASGIPEVLVAYGFGCECPDNMLYQDVVVPTPRLPKFIAEAEAADFYRVGRDNLHLITPDGRAEFLLGHESDVQLITEDAGLAGKLRSARLADGHRRLFGRIGGEWREVPTPGPADDPPV